MFVVKFSDRFIFEHSAIAIGGLNGRGRILYIACGTKGGGWSPGV